MSGDKVSINFFAFNPLIEITEVPLVSAESDRFKLAAITNVESSTIFKVSGNPEGDFHAIYRA